MKLLKQLYSKWLAHLFLWFLQFLCRLWAPQLGHAVQILLQTQQEAQGNWEKALSLLTFCRDWRWRKVHPLFYADIKPCGVSSSVYIVWKIKSSKHWLFVITLVLHDVQKETGPLHQLWPEEESQCCRSHRCLRCKYPFNCPPVLLLIHTSVCLPVHH